MLQHEKMLTSKEYDQNGGLNGYLRTNRLLSERIKSYLPSVFLTNGSTLLFPLVDTLIVGNLIGDDALAAVSLTTPIFLLCSIIARVLASGLSKTIAVYLGKNDKHGINRCFQANRIILILGFFATFMIQIPLAYVVISSYSIKSNNYGMVWAYFISSTIGAPFDFVKSICVYNLRAFGKLKNLAKMTIITQVINLVGDIVLIRFCGLGIYGAGFATSISQIVFGVSSFVFVSKYTDIHKFEKKPWRQELRIIVKTGFPKGLAVGLNAIQSWAISFLVLYALDMEGVAAKAACSSCYSILSIMYLSVSEVMQPLAGVLHGAEDRAGSKNLLRLSLTLAVSLTLFFQILIELFPGSVLAIYGIRTPSANQIAILRIFCSFVFLGAFVNVSSDYFSSIQKAGVASVLTSLNGSPVFIPILLLLSATLGGVYIWYAYLFTAIIAALAAVYYLRKHVRTELSNNETNKNEWYLSILPEDGVKISELLVQNIQSKGVDKMISVRMGIFLEELTMYIWENSPEARIDITIKEKESAFTILLFDNGKHRDYKFDLDHTELYDRLRVARLISHDVFYQNILGLNYVSASFAKEDG